MEDDWREERSEALKRSLNLFIAPNLWNEASIETRDSLEGNKDFYEKKNYSYIPLPYTNEYHDVESDQTNDIADEQFINEGTSAIRVLELLKEYPFVLCDMVEQSYRKEDFANLDREDYLEKVEEGKSVYSESDRWRIITWADFKKREAKEMLYPLIAEFSETMANEIEKFYGDSEEIVDLNQLKPATTGRWFYDRKSGSEIHIAEYLDMTEMKQVVVTDDKLLENCGFNSKTQARDTIDEVAELRNKIMHANRSLVDSEEDLKEIDKVIDEINSVLVQISD